MHTRTPIRSRARERETKIDKSNATKCAGVCMHTVANMLGALVSLCGDADTGWRNAVFSIYSVVTMTIENMLGTQSSHRLRHRGGVFGFVVALLPVLCGCVCADMGSMRSAWIAGYVTKAQTGTTSQPLRWRSIEAFEHTSDPRSDIPSKWNVKSRINSEQCNLFDGELNFWFVEIAAFTFADQSFPLSQELTNTRNALLARCLGTRLKDTISNFWKWNFCIQYFDRWMSEWQKNAEQNWKHKWNWSLTSENFVDAFVAKKSFPWNTSCDIQYPEIVARAEISENLTGYYVRRCAEKDNQCYFHINEVFGS